MRQPQEKKQWANLFQQSNLTGRGIDLAYITPVVKDNAKLVQFQANDVDMETEKWRKTIILYVVGSSPTIGAVKRFVAEQWNFAAKPKIYCHNEGYFVVLFNSLED